MHDSSDKYIEFSARIIDEKEVQHFTDILQKSNIDLHGWAGIIRCELEKKDSVIDKLRGKHTTRIDVTMVVIAWPCDSKTGCSLISEINSNLRKYKSEFFT